MSRLLVGRLTILGPFRRAKAYHEEKAQHIPRSPAHEKENLKYVHHSTHSCQDVVESSRSS
jgi:hypothetical protein